MNRFHADSLRMNAAIDQAMQEIMGDTATMLHATKALIELNALAAVSPYTTTAKFLINECPEEHKSFVAMVLALGITTITTRLTDAAGNMQEEL